MKALVLSGGKGTRLRPFSYSMPKQLIPIANKPVLEHILDNLRAVGVEETGIIVGDWGPEIRALLGDGSRYGMRITYIPQAEPRGLAHCVALARDFLGDDDFVMYLGDNMLPQGIAQIAGEFRERRPAAQVVVHKVPDPRAFGVAEVDAHGRVTHLVEKPLRPVSDLALIGVYFFTPAIHDAVAAIRPSARGELEITDAVALLVARGEEVRASEYDGYWRDTGRVEDVLECNRELLDTLAPRVAGEVDAASELVGQVVVETGARVVRSRIHGPAVVGAGTVVEDSWIGPHTAIGRDCVLSDARLDYSIALDGATVRHVHGIHGSLIGRAAVVRCDVTGPGRHRLVVGDHTTVEVAA
ncbi:glucose-1-phosphate thymidylyltransferase [Streptomyces echinoruber]|jgi:glucose-1-phosphate thymidylyltransferase|uniref:Glucose-1-phosphate thymidylyltransferase n=1 Tax=Streptomyces echinoruber TaxID=68898 RepID=A0A918V9L0_9ACTN|nr:glucose-1-phosphate thymidylyltransferase [Streptomyces echinoruber]GGZ81839.1 glucose-1-phosphate thymidylyltransferase [Streptomyces echinoruber]